MYLYSCKPGASMSAPLERTKGPRHPRRNNSANTVARVVANQILPLWGAPIQIESDQGTHFTGQVMKQICQMLNIKQRFHILYRPQSSGMVERANRTIKESISKQVAQHKNQWIDAHSPNNTAGNSFKSHRYQSIRTHDWKSHEAAHRPRNCPSKPGAPRGCNSTVCAQAITREAGSATCTRCSETTAIRLNE